MVKILSFTHRKNDKYQLMKIKTRDGYPPRVSNLKFSQHYLSTFLIAACAAATLAIGTLYGEQLT